MQFLIVARDVSDAEASERRRVHRAAHLENVDRPPQAGRLLIGGLILDDQMTGLAFVAQFDSRAKRDECLHAVSYRKGGVWQIMEVIPYQISPFCRLTAPQLVKAQAPAAGTAAETV